MFTPSDCHYVEFNYLPDDPIYVEDTNQVRQPSLNAAWAKGGSGKFYNVEANNVTNKSRPPRFYEADWMKMSVRDVARSMILINADLPNGGILLSNASASNYPHHLESILRVPYRKSKERKSRKPKAKPAVEVNATTTVKIEKSAEANE